jgi:peptidoglycan/xylan/chitin deacetylase (PgdA/CDA1 family)
VLGAALAFTGCAGPADTPVFHSASGSPAAAATPSATPPPASPPAPPPSSPTPSRSPAAPAGTVKNAAWYVAQVPKFAAPPIPQKITAGKGGKAAFWYRVPTEQKVAFITIDDGGLTRSAEALELIRQARIPVTLFLNSPAGTTYAPYFKQIQDTGAVVENHTITHTSLRGKSYDFQKREICGAADKLGEVYGQRPTLFRPPFGEKDDVTLRAAADCGMKVVFYWTQTVDKGIVRYQTTEKVVRPGDVLLMHFRPALADDLLAALNAIHAAGLTPALLEDYIA